MKLYREYREEEQRKQKEKEDRETAGITSETIVIYEQDHLMDAVSRWGRILAGILLFLVLLAALCVGITALFLEGSS